MSWTIAEDGDFVHVRASINAKTHQKEITDLIDALVKRAGAPLQPADARAITKENTDERPDA